MKGQVSLEAVSMRGQQDRLRPLPEEKSVQRDAKPSWQVTCSLWTVDICLQAGEDSVLPSQAAEGELGLRCHSRMPLLPVLHFCPHLPTASTSILAFTRLCPMLHCG